MDEELFSDEEAWKYADQLVRIIQENSPERDQGSYPREIKWHGRVVSPYPGNLKKNGNEIVNKGNGYVVKHGYAPAPYALYANKRSRKSGYIQKSVELFKGYMEKNGWFKE